VIDPTIPIDFDFAPEIEPAAAAAYEAYHDGRAHRPWRELRPELAFRWRLMVHVVRDWPVSTVTGQGLRDIYLTLLYAKSWHGLARDDREKWRRVRDALIAARGQAGQPVQGVTR